MVVREPTNISDSTNKYKAAIVIECEFSERTVAAAAAAAAVSSGVWSSEHLAVGNIYLINLQVCLKISAIYMMLVFFKL